MLYSRDDNFQTGKIWLDDVRAQKVATNYVYTDAKISGETWQSNLDILMKIRKIVAYSNNKYCNFLFLPVIRFMNQPACFIVSINLVESFAEVTWSNLSLVAPLSIRNKFEGSRRPASVCDSCLSDWKYARQCQLFCNLMYLCILCIMQHYQPSFSHLTKCSVQLQRL